MNYHQYYPVDIVNGPGTRCTLFVSGCVHECPGCYNKSTWRVNSGQPFTKAMEDQIINDLNDTRIKRQGISLSGGDPLHPQNVPDILKLVKRIRAECPGKDIWVWTGYKLDELNAAVISSISLFDDVKPINGHPYTNGGHEIRACTSLAPYWKNVDTLSRSWVPRTIESSQNTTR